MSTSTDNLIIQSVAKRVTSLRELKGYSQEELADRCDLHPTSIKRLEEGKINPTLLLLHKIAQGLDLPPKELMEV